jgi:hypothetical protein
MEFFAILAQEYILISISPITPVLAEQTIICPYQIKITRWDPVDGQANNRGLRKM